MSQSKPKLWTPGDWNAFFGFGTNILVNMLVLTGLLRFVLKMPDALVFGRILPATGLMLCLSTFYYARLAYKLAEKTGRKDVCALPSGISVPHMFVVVFVIMLLNVEEEEHRRPRLRFLVPAAVVLAGVLIAEVAFILVTVQQSPVVPGSNTSDVGLTQSIGSALFTRYLLPFEITSILLLMAIVGAMTLARRGGLLPPRDAAKRD